ncbi:MAG TPA: carboxypeptidase-like regulatory domain-containing protein, partial [Acidimicrobiia bacterium]|nr:carboxypeptidase-like regulatory domain-containing protein [Acidimicrobiia bacterium]
MSVRMRWLCGFLSSSLLLGFMAAHPAAAIDAASGRISGVVRDSNGTPQAEAKVVLATPVGATVSTDTTGESGRYSFTVPEGVYDLGVLTRSPSRVARVRGVQVSAESTLDIVALPPYVTLSGTVRDQTGAPVRSGRVTFGDQYRVSAASNIDGEGNYQLRARPGTYPLSVTVTGGNGSTYLYASIDAFTLTDDRVQDLTFAATRLTIDGRDRRGQPVAVAAANVYSPNDCHVLCPAGFELFPGSGEAAGVWRSYERSGTVLALPGDLVVTAAPADPTLNQVTARSVSAPWPNPLTVVMDDAPPPSQTPPPPPPVNWEGTIRHNGVPLAGVGLGVLNDGGHAHDETDADGRFRLSVIPGRYRFNLSAYIGTTVSHDSDPEGPGLGFEASEVDITANRISDIDIRTADLPVQVVDGDGNPRDAFVSGTSTTSIELFPGARATGSVENNMWTDGGGHATFVMFPGSPPPVIHASAGYATGSATPAASDRSVVVEVRDDTVTLSGTVRDARGPLPVINWPWVSFSGPASRYEDFEGDHLGATGEYALQAMPGKHRLIISDEPDFDEADTDDHVATPTLPEVWTITTTVELSRSKTLDLLIPDAFPARFQAVD